MIVERMQGLDPADFPGVLVNRHAPFAWGPTVGKAVETAVAIECIARMALMSLQLAPDLEPIETDLLNKHFRRKHGAGAYYGQRPYPVAGTNVNHREPSRTTPDAPPLQPSATLLPQLLQRNLHAAEIEREHEADLTASQPQDDAAWRWKAGPPTGRLPPPIRPRPPNRCPGCRRQLWR